MIQYSQIIVLVFLSVLTSSSQDIPRKRLAYRGLVLPKAFAPAKWQVSRTVAQESTQGDLFFVETNVQPNEKQAISIYAWAVKLKEENGKWIEEGQPFRIAASDLGREWGYESKTFKSAGAFASTVNTSNEQETRQVQLFLPFEAMSLPHDQNLEIRYEIAVSVGADFLDKFFINRKFRRIVVSSQSFREEITVMLKKDSMLEFVLVGAEDDVPDY